MNRVQVVVRVRPVLTHEDIDQVAVSCSPGADKVQVLLPDRSGSSKQLLPGASRSGAKSYSFDVCLPGKTTQAELFETCGMHELVEAALSGYSVTVFAFGQTGSGKTHTMIGPRLSRFAADGGINTNSKAGSQYNEAEDGLLPRCLHTAFNSIKEREGMEFSVSANCLELYNENVTDLLGPERERQCQVRQDTQGGFKVDGLTEVPCRSVAAALKAIGHALQYRHTRAHSMNEYSSRSHCLMTFNFASKEQPQEGGPKGGVRRYGKLVLVDLAGSERLKETGNSGTLAMRETGSINRSLFTLGQVLAAQSARSSGGPAASSAHVPYRNSKLTSLLWEGLRGTGRALMLACLSPMRVHAEECLSTLHFASMAMRIKAEPVVLMDPQDQLVLELRNTIRQLREDNRMLALAMSQLSSGNAADTVINCLPESLRHPGGQDSVSAGSSQLSTPSVKEDGNNAAANGTVFTPKGNRSDASTPIGKQGSRAGRNKASSTNGSTPTCMSADGNSSMSAAASSCQATGCADSGTPSPLQPPYKAAPKAQTVWPGPNTVAAADPGGYASLNCVQPEASQSKQQQQFQLSPRASLAASSRLAQTDLLPRSSLDALSATTPGTSSSSSRRPGRALSAQSTQGSNRTSSRQALQLLNGTGGRPSMATELARSTQAWASTSAAPGGAVNPLLEVAGKRSQGGKHGIHSKGLQQQAALYAPGSSHALLADGSHAQRPAVSGACSSLKGKPGGSHRSGSRGSSAGCSNAAGQQRGRFAASKLQAFPELDAMEREFQQMLSNGSHLDAVAPQLLAQHNPQQAAGSGCHQPEEHPCTTHQQDSLSMLQEGSQASQLPCMQVKPTQASNSPLLQDTQAYPPQLLHHITLHPPPAQQQQQETQRPEPKALSWAERNPWFGTDLQMTALVYQVHDEIVGRQGVDPASDAYYATLESRVQLAFPERWAVQVSQQQDRSPDVRAGCISGHTNRSRQPQPYIGAGLRVRLKDSVPPASASLPATGGAPKTMQSPADARLGIFQPMWHLANSNQNGRRQEQSPGASGGGHLQQLHRLSLHHNYVVRQHPTRQQQQQGQDEEQHEHMQHQMQHEHQPQPSNQLQRPRQPSPQQGPSLSLMAEHHSSRESSLCAEPSGHTALDQAAANWSIPPVQSAFQHVNHDSSSTIGILHDCSQPVRSTSGTGYRRNTDFRSLTAAAAAARGSSKKLHPSAIGTPAMLKSDMSLQDMQEEYLRQRAAVLEQLQQTKAQAEEDRRKLMRKICKQIGTSRWNKQ